MKVRDVMTAETVACLPDAPLPEVARVMCDNDCGALPVVDVAGRVLGVITDRDIACRAVAQERDVRHATAEECMSPNAITTTPEATLDEARRLLAANQIRRLVVVDRDGRCAGMLSQADIARRAPPAETGQLVREVSQEGRPVALTY
jgi:CBS domain-containing protein